MAQISVLLALEALREQCEALALAESVVERERAIRDNLIRDAREGGVSYRSIVALTNLSRDRLYTIVTKPPTESGRLSEKGVLPS
jgi:hypothetical protein